MSANSVSVSSDKLVQPAELFSTSHSLMLTVLSAQSGMNSACPGPGPFMRPPVFLIRPSGLVPYRDAVLVQQRLVKTKLDQISSKKEDADYLMLLQHPSTYTAGRRLSGFADEQRTRLEGLGANVYECGRGGQATWHGAGQWVLYPILNLRHFAMGIRAYSSALEQVLVGACRGMGVVNVEPKDAVGVWVGGERKIGFVGFRNSRWVTSHGVSLNVCNELAWFQEIAPCGINGLKVTSIAEELQGDGHAELQGNRNDLLEQSATCLIRSFEAGFGTTVVPYSGACEPAEPLK